MPRKPVKYWLSPREVSELYGIACQTLSQWRWQRKGPDFYKFGGKIKYSIEDLRAWADKYLHKCSNK